MKIKLGRTVTITVSKLKKRHNTYCFRQPIPKDLQMFFGKTEITKSLSHDLAEATKQAERLDSFYKAEFKRLRGLGDVNKASQLLHTFGLEAKEAPAIDLGDGTLVSNPDYERLVEHLRDSTFQGHNDQGEEEHIPLEPFERLALDIASGKVVQELPKPIKRSKHTIDRLIEWNLDHKDFKGKRKQSNELRLAFKQFREVVTVSTVKEITFLMAQRFQEYLVERGYKNATVNKRVFAVRKAIKRYSEAQGDNTFDPFNRVRKLNVKEDQKRRATISRSDLTAIQASLSYKNETEIVIGILSDSCCRISEIAGLKMEEVKLDADVPYMVIHDNGDRGTKNENSVRYMPLVGVSLKAAKAAVNQAVEGQVFLFPCYFDDGVYNTSDRASANVNKWLRERGYDATSHSFRHTMATRLREADIPQPFIDNIGGWTGNRMSDNYGKKTSLKKIREALERALSVQEWDLFGM